MIASIASINNDQDILDMVRAMAHANGQRLRTMSPRQQRKFARRSIKAHEVAWVIWIERNEYHCYCIKGRGRLGRLSTTAFAVEGRADAIGMAEEWGDGAPHLAHDMPPGVM